MKKTTKGALAAGAAAVLLAGGAGTYAAWQDSETADGGSVTTGHLTVTQTEAPAWTWVTGGTPDAAVLPATTLVPGDTIRFEGTYTLGIVGTNLEAELDVSTSGNAGAFGELVWTPDSANTQTLSGLNEEDDDGQVVTVGGTLAFPGAATGTMDQTYDLGEITVALEQTAPAAVGP